MPRYIFSGDNGPFARTLLDVATSLGPDAYCRQNEIAISRLDSRPRPSQIAMPAILVSGACDRLRPPLRHVEIDEAFPDARRQVLPDCGHMVPLEAPHRLHDLIVQLHTN